MKSQIWEKPSIESKSHSLGHRAGWQVKDSSRMQPNARGTMKIPERRKSARQWKNIEIKQTFKLWTLVTFVIHPLTNQGRLSITWQEQSISRGTCPLEREMGKHLRGKGAQWILSKGRVRFKFPSNTHCLCCFYKRESCIISINSFSYMICHTVIKLYDTEMSCLIKCHTS